MTDEQVERIANALAQVSSELDPTKPAPTVSEHHRKLARVAIQTLERVRLKAVLQNVAPIEESFGDSRGAGAKEN